MESGWKKDYAHFLVIEERMGIGFFAIAQKIVSHALTIKEMVLLWSLCSAETPEESGEHIMRVGLLEASNQLAAYFDSVLTGAVIEKPIQAEFQEMRSRFPD